MEPISITYTLSQEDFLLASGQLWDHRAIGDVGNWVCVGVVGVLGTTLVLQGAILGWGALFVAAMVGGLTLSRRFFWRSAYQLADRFSKPITVVFTETEIQTTTWLQSGSVSLETYKTYLETEQFLILLIDPKSISILPKSAFEAGDLERLRAHIAQHLKPERKRWF